MNVRKHFSEDDGFSKINYYNNENNDNDVPLKNLSNNNQNNHQSIFRRNIIYISMIILIVLAIILKNYDIGESLKVNLDIDIYKYDFFNKTNVTIDTIINDDANKKIPILEEENDYVMDFKKKYIYPNYWTLLFIFVSTIIIIFILFANYLKEEQSIFMKNEIEMEDQIRSDPYLIKQSTYQYEQLRDYYTRRELEKLYNSEQFRKMRQEKGDNLINWNWQMKEKAMKDVYREKGTESEDISHLSLSD